MNLRLTVAVLCGAAAFAACDKNGVQQLPLAPIAAARIKFSNFGVNGTPAVNFYANETKMTAIFTTDTVESTVGVGYGAAANGGLYLAITPGTYTLTGRIAAATNKNLPIDTLGATLADGSSYSFYLSGAYDTTAKQVDAFIVQDPVPAQWNYAVAYVRFVHAIFNANPMTLYVKNTDTTVTKDSIAVSGVVAYKGSDQFAAIPSGVYNLFTRYAGSNTNVISRSNVSFVGGHVYTIGARGDITKTSGTFVPTLDNAANR